MMGKSIAAQKCENAHMNIGGRSSGKYRPAGVQYKGAPLGGASAQSGGVGAGKHRQTPPEAEAGQTKGTTQAGSVEDERASEPAKASRLSDYGAAQRDARAPETGTLTSGIVSAQVVTGDLDATPEVADRLQEEGPEAAARAAEHAAQGSGGAVESADD